MGSSLDFFISIILSISDQSGSLDSLHDWLHLTRAALTTRLSELRILVILSQFSRRVSLQCGGQRVSYVFFRLKIAQSIQINFQ
ncbi:MAG: hypothetical protein A2Y53_04560 [Chloroflexi bacterium RBG_16_47_49]|nr:MAG: hypothetical protein A2Y53_04560 [Chloroflexi bacterium RBG_16_47_49]